MAVAHLAFDLRAGHKGGHGVDDDDVQRAGAGERLRNGKGVFAVVGLGNEQRIHIHAEGLGIDRIKGVLRVDERGLTACLLRFGNAVQSKGGLTGGLGAVDLNDAALWKTADAGRNVQRDRAGVDGFHVQLRALSKAHDGALAILLFNLRERCFQRGSLVCHREILLFGTNVHFDYTTVPRKNQGVFEKS